MREPTVQGVRALAKLDGTIPPQCVDRAIDALSGKTAAELVSQKRVESVITRAQAAEILHVCEKTIDNYARQGLVKRFKITRKRSLGLTRSSVEILAARRKGMVV